MFNVTTIQANLYKAVGCRQPYNPDYAVLDADNLVSRSGYYATDNPLCKIEFLKDSQDYASISDSNFNVVLKRMQEDAISSVAGMVFNGSDYIDRQVLYKNAQNRVNTETLTSGFICHKICVSSEKNIAFEIKRVLLDFEGAGDIEILLFNTSQSTPIQSQVVTIASTHQVVELNWKVDNSGDTYKGEYYLGYLTNYGAIGTLKPYKRDYENSDIESVITHLGIDTYIFDSHATNTLPDLLSEEASDFATGLNPDITVYEDYTDLITQNESLLAKAINLQFQIQFLSVSIGSLRSNRNERISSDMANRMLAEINGLDNESTVKVTGLRPLLLGQISRIKKEIRRLQKGYFSDVAKVDTLI